MERACLNSERDEKIYWGAFRGDEVQPQQIPERSGANANNGTLALRSIFDNIQRYAKLRIINIKGD